MFNYFQIKKVEKNKYVIGDCLGINGNLCISVYYVSSEHRFNSLYSFLKKTNKKGIHKKVVVEYAVLLFYFCIGLHKHICSRKRISARLL